MRLASKLQQKSRESLCVMLPRRTALVSMRDCLLDTVGLRPLSRKGLKILWLLVHQEIPRAVFLQHLLGRHTSMASLRSNSSTTRARAQLSSSEGILDSRTPRNGGGESSETVTCTPRAGCSLSTWGRGTFPARDGEHRTMGTPETCVKLRGICEGSAG